LRVAEVKRAMVWATAAAEASGLEVREQKAAQVEGDDIGENGVWC